MTYLTQFAETGNPNQPHDNLPDWETWSNVEGGPKALEINGDMNDVFLSMSTETVTFDQVAIGLFTEIQTLSPEVMYTPYQFQWFVPYIPPEAR